MGFHVLCGNDNWTFAFDGGPGQVATCSNCKGVLGKDTRSLAGIRIRRRKYDISFTYDGACVVTEKFKTCCEASNFTGAQFRPLPDDPGFYILWPAEVVQIDAEAEGMQFEERCDECGRHKGVYCGTVRLKSGSVVPAKGFAATDLWFAGISSYDERGPMLLCGDEAAKILLGAGLKGLWFADEEVPLAIPAPLLAQALPMLRQAARRVKARPRRHWDGKNWSVIQPTSSFELEPPIVHVRLRSGSVIGEVVIDWTGVLSCEGRPTDLDHTPEYEFDGEIDEEGLDYESEDIVAIGVPVRYFLGLRRRLAWFEMPLDSGRALDS